MSRALGLRDRPVRPKPKHLNRRPALLVVRLRDECCHSPCGTWPLGLRARAVMPGEPGEGVEPRGPRPLGGDRSRPANRPTGGTRLLGEGANRNPGQNTHGAPLARLPHSGRYPCMRSLPASQGVASPSRSDSSRARLQLVGTVGNQGTTTRQFCFGVTTSSLRPANP